MKQSRKTTYDKLGAERIRKNLGLDEGDVVGWCRAKMKEAGIGSMSRQGKNWYVQVGDAVVTVNAHSYTVITAHKGKRRPKNKNADTFTAAELKEALQAVESTISKCEKVLPN